MAQLDPEDVIPTPQEQIDWNALTQPETDEFDQMLRDMALVPSPLWGQAVPGVRAVPADEGCSQTITSAQQEEGKGKDEEERGEEEKGEEKDEEDEEDEEEKEEKEEREKTSEIPRTDGELLALPFKELTLTEFERVERIFFEQAAAAAAAEAAEAAAEVERKSNKEELKLLKIPFSMLSLTQFEDVERLFLNGGVPAELIPAIPNRRAPVEEPKQAEVTKAKKTLLDFEEVESSFSDVEMFVMPILQNQEQTEGYVIHWLGRFFCRINRGQY